MRIKVLSGSSAIDQICVEGVSKLYELSEAEGVQRELDAIKERRFDPTN
jgi:hypothetical protein